MNTVLLVSPDPTVGGPIADGLESAGYDVMWCCGPSGSECVCAAFRNKQCALTSGIDAVVLDTWLESDRLDRGLRSWRLLNYYEDLGLPVIVLHGRHMTVSGTSHESLSRRSSPDVVVEAVDAVVKSRILTEGEIGRTA